MPKESFYIHDEIVHNSRAAEIILPLLFEKHRPSSVLDVGCGLGNWLEVARKLGVRDIKGIDGNYVDRSLLKIPNDDFFEANLNEAIDLDKNFDLAICLEVAEHLLPQSADNIIKTLTIHADVILFSAAIPGQGGQYHINEQWPAYWQEKFRNMGYEMIDYFRPLIWDNDNIEYWYRQNLFLVVKNGHSLESCASNSILPLVHPFLFEKILQEKNEKIEYLKTNLKRLASRDIMGRIRKLFK